MLLVLLNTNWVQTFFARKASQYFSKAWNADVRIESLNIGIFSYLTLTGVYVVDPEGELVCDAETIKCTFKGFPLRNGLHLEKVYLRNTEFHLKILEEGINLYFIIDYFKSNKPDDDTTKMAFPIHVGVLEMDNVTFSLQNMRENEDSTIISPQEVNVRDMRYNHIHAVMKDIVVIGDSIHANFKSFSTTEKSGFVLKNMNMDATISSTGIQVKNAIIETPYSNLLFDASLQYNGWEKMGSFVDSVYINALFKQGSYGNMKDAAFWASSLSNADVFAYFNADVSGTISDLTCHSFSASFGQHSLLKLKGKLKGLPKIKQSMASAEVELISGSLEDFNNLQFPKQWNIPSVPAFLTNKGKIVFKAHVEGSMDNCTSSFNLYSDLGDVHGTVKLNTDKRTKEYVYVADMETTPIRFHPILHTDWLQKAQLHVLVDGKGFNLSTMETKIDIDINGLTVKNYEYGKGRISGMISDNQFSGDVRIHDKNIELNVRGHVDLGSPYKKSDFDLVVKNARLLPLKFDFIQDSSFVFSTHIKGSFEGFNIDDLTGNILVKNTSLAQKDKKISLEDIQILLSGINSERELAVVSEVFDLGLNGDFKFKDFGSIANKFMYHFFPQYNPVVYNAKSDSVHSEFEFMATIKDFSKIRYFLNDQIGLAKSTRLTGKYSEKDFFVIDFKSDTFQFKGFMIEQMELHTARVDSLYDINVLSPFVYLNDIILMRNMAVSVQSNRSIVNIDLWWDDKKDTAFSNGGIHFRADVFPKSIRFNFLDSKMFIHGTHWSINENHNIIYRNGDFQIDNLNLEAGKQIVRIDGEISEDAENELTLNLENFNLSILNFFTKPYNVALGGDISGKFILDRSEKKTYFKVDSKIDHLNLNNEDLGDAIIKSTWDNLNERIKIQFITNIDTLSKKMATLSANGYFYPSKKEDNLDFKVELESFKLNSLSSLIESFVSNIEGTVSGLLDIKGSLKNPNIKGYLGIHSGAVLVKLLNTKYYLNDTCYLSGDAISFKHFKITDSLDNSAFVDGKILINDFKNLQFNLNLVSDKFLFMNTSASSNTSYYGMVVASTNATLQGNMKDMKLIINAKAEKGTSIVIPITTKAQLEEQKYIRFVSKVDSFYSNQNPLLLEKNSALSIVINLLATPDAKISIPMDFNQFAGNITASGEGNLRLGINSKDGFTIHGNYTVNTGTIKMKFLSLIEKDFALENGGTIQWTGNPIDANMNIKAIRTLKTSLAPLFPGEEENYKREVDVQSIVTIQGKLTNPNPRFDIKFPHADQSMEDRVFTKIDRNNELQMMEQTLSLLFLGGFYISNSDINWGDEGISSGVNVFASQISAVLSNMLGLNLDISYKENQIKARVTKEWDRFFIDVGGKVNTSPENSIDSENDGFIGDVLIGWKISNYWNVNGFNRSNINDFTKAYSPYTQGAGIMFKKDFESIKDLFSRRKDDDDPEKEESKKEEEKLK